MKSIKIGNVRDIADAMRRDFNAKVRSPTIGRTVLLIGAGCSHSAGIPLAAEIAKELVVTLATDYGLLDESQRNPSDAIRALINSGRFKFDENHENTDGELRNIDWYSVYDNIFSYHYCTPKEIRRVFSDIFRNIGDRINWTHICIGELARLGYVSTVLTTNFDQLALKGMAWAGRLPIVADGIESLNRITGDSNIPQLVQIHGSLNTYYLRNSVEDTDEIAVDIGARHAIDELIRTAKIFIAVGYGGRERGFMNLLIDAAKRHPDTRIFWISHSSDVNNISSLTEQFLRTSRFSSVILGQDSDEFFRSLLEELSICSPKIIQDPLSMVKELRENLVFSENPIIAKAISEHEMRVSDINLANESMSALIHTKGEKDQSLVMQAVGELAGGIAHDFNNMLTSIIGYADLFLAIHSPTDSSYSDIMQIKANANRAASHVRQLLAFSRRQPLRPQVFLLGNAISDLKILLSRVLGDNIVLEINLESELWFCKIDSASLDNCILNLVVNARDAMPDGGKIVLKTRNVEEANTSEMREPDVVRGDYVLIEVEDNGHGMPADVKRRIFEPYFTTKEVGKGTGLGLSSVYGFVKQSGGYISCDSIVGKGTTFRIYLPRYIPNPDEVRGQVQIETVAFETDSKRQVTILLVEDEEAVRGFGARALASRGYRVIQAGSGVEALKALEARNYEVELIVSNVVMPEMDGLAMLRELRKRSINTKIMFVSGYNTEDFKKKIPEGELVEFLPKPFSLKQLVTAVGEALNCSNEVRS